MYALCQPEKKKQKKKTPTHISQIFINGAVQFDRLLEHECDCEAGGPVLVGADKTLSKLKGR